MAPHLQITTGRGTPRSCERFACILLCLFALCPVALRAQVERPRLVVGIVIDQMRWDYLYRYHARYGEGGFKRLLSEGFSCEQTFIPYVPSVTAIGHSCVWTGSVPSISGIAGNDFCIDGQKVYCCDDKSVTPVGTTSEAGLMSPRNLWVTTVGDELRIATNDRAKVVGVSLKDRASILPAGRHPNGAYWFDDAVGGFITSSYYMDQLPQWVEDFNARRLPDTYLNQTWRTLYPLDTYTQSTADDSPAYEGEICSGFGVCLPYDLKAMYEQSGYAVLRNTPWGNTLTFSMAQAAIEGEDLGNGPETDMLCISCSSTDYLGHIVGTHAVEIEDMYLRLDQELARFLSYLDERIGQGQYIVFLTADHGVLNTPPYLSDRQIPSGLWNKDEYLASLNAALQEHFPSDTPLVSYVMNFQVFFNEQAIDSLGYDYAAVKACVVDALKRDPCVHYAVDMDAVGTATIPEAIRERIINGYCRERSGGVQVVAKPGWHDRNEPGTTHSVWAPYDTHIPLLFMGWGIPQGSTTRTTYMTDIAPTVAALLHIQMPSGSIGTPIF